MSFGQVGPGWGPGGPSGGSSTPDWNALAERTAAERARRRRWWIVGGGALATVAVAAVVAVAVVSESGGGASGGPSAALPTPEELPSTPGESQPGFDTASAPPPPDPRDFITDPAKDTAPLSAGTLFPQKEVEVDGRAFARTATDSSEDCTDGATGDLTAVLTGNTCRGLHRATFVRDGIAVTVGVAVFDSQKAAGTTKNDAEPHVAPLRGGAADEFCRYSACRTTANSLGRYAYFTVSGYLDGTDVTAEETQARAAGLDIAGYAFQRIRERGEEQAVAAATASPDAEADAG